MYFNQFSRFGRIIFSATFAFGVSSAAVSAATHPNVEAKPAMADAQIFLAKRTNGPARTAETTASEETANVSRSNGRGRTHEDVEIVEGADAEAPVALEFAREVSGSRAAGSNGRGRHKSIIAEEVPSFDLADTAPEALDAAQPETPAALMARYQEARHALFQAATHQDETYAAYRMLKDFDAAQVSTLYPQGGYDLALNEAQAAFNAAREDVALKQAATQDLLLEISGGVALSDGAVRELNGLLGV